MKVQRDRCERQQSRQVLQRLSSKPVVQTAQAKCMLQHGQNTHKVSMNTELRCLSEAQCAFRTTSEHVEQHFEFSQSDWSVCSLQGFLCISPCSARARLRTALIGRKPAKSKSSVCPLHITRNYGSGATAATADCGVNGDLKNTRVK